MGAHSAVREQEVDRRVARHALGGANRWWGGPCRLWRRRALDENHEFPLKDGVFTSDVLDVWLEYKRQHELDPVRLRPHPWEFYLYFDV